MPLTTGTRLGPYDIIGVLGAGGMGEVYRARDSKLDRDVAIKVLPALFAQDAERLARFGREAKTLAALNHPNIATLYGLEESSSGIGLVMELVEGEELAVDRGPMPLADALPIARQLAEAIEAAHEQGVIHRDLKPANIKIRHDGMVKVLDFGLAKALNPDSPGSHPDLMNSPTFTSMPNNPTEMGMIIGTAAYMAPEQARGKAVDRRADIWSFGVVLFELISGTRAFPGEDVSQVLAKVIEREPDFSALPATTPPALRKLLTRCLTKDPKQRLRDIGEARIALAEAEREAARPSGAAAETATSVAKPSFGRRVLPWALVAGLTIGLVLSLVPARATTNVRPMTLRTQITLPEGVELYTAVGAAISLSPDGSTLAFVGVDNGVRRVFVRRLDQFEVTPIRGTEAAVSCVFSPDGRELLVGLADTALHRVRMADKVIETVVDAASEFLGGWTGDGRVVYTHDNRLWIKETARDSVPTALTKAGADNRNVDFKSVPVPGRNALLFATASPDAPEAGRIEAISLDDLKQTTVVEKAASPLITASGHLVFLRESVMFAAPFDSKTMTLKGEPTPVLSNVAVVRNRGVSAVISVSDSGTLVYAPTSSSDSDVVSVSRQGEVQTLATVAKAASNPRLTDDGRWLLFEEIGGGLWIQDLARRSLARLTDGSALASFPIFTRDGRDVIFRTASGLFRQPLDGSAKATQIPGTQSNEYPNGLSPDGTMLFYTRIDNSTSGDIYVLPLAGGTPKSLLKTMAYEGAAQLSPDGKWLLYVSNERGGSEVFLQPYPALDRRIQVSSSGGVQPSWNRKGDEIVYRSGNSMMSVRLTATPTGPALSPPVALFSGRYAYGGGLTIPNFSVTRDGDHFILVKDKAGASLNVVTNWFEELPKAK